jgi:hypothetical protein
MFHYVAANWLQIFLSTGIACYALHFVWSTQRWEVKYQKQRHGDAVKFQQERHEDARGRAAARSAAVRDRRAG